MIARYTTSFGMAAGVTFGLLLLMQVLIVTGKSSISPTNRITHGPVLFDSPKDTPVQTNNEPERPKPVDPAPPLTTSAAIDPGAWSVGPGFKPTGKIVLPAIPAVLSGDAMLIMAPAVIFPRRMLSRGIEGYVIVEFTVTTEGTVRNVVVLESSHSGFEQAAIKAATQMKYKPNVVDGTPQPVHNVMYRFTFNIEED